MGGAKGIGSAYRRDRPGGSDGCKRLRGADDCCDGRISRSRTGVRRDDCERARRGRGDQRPSGASEGWILGSRHWLHRRGVRRHRHQPALRLPGGHGPGGQRSRHPSRYPRRGVFGALGADPGGDGQIRPVRHAGGQQGRGRGAVPDGAGAAGHGQAHPGDLPPGSGGLGAVLRRRHHHPCDLGARRLPGHARRASPEAHRHAAPDHHRLVRDPDRRLHGAGRGAPPASPSCSRR